MRFLTALLFASLVAGGLSTSATAQPTAESFWPVSVGNVWQLHDASGGYTAVVVVDREIAGVGGEQLPVLKEGESECALRLSLAGSQLRAEYLSASNPAEPCRSVLDLPGATGDFLDEAPHFSIDLSVFVEGTYMVASEEVEAMMWSGSTPGIGGMADTYSFLSGVGPFTYETDVFGAELEYDLVFAEIDGRPFGTPISGEAAPETTDVLLSIGPNPARSSVRVFVTGAAPSVRVTVTDALGRRVQTIDAASGAVSLDVRAFAAGVYTVRAESADGAAVGRFTVSH